MVNRNLSDKRLDKNKSYKSRKRKKKIRRIKFILLSAVLLILFFISALVGYGLRQLNQLKSNNISKSDEDLGISSDTKKILEDKNNDVTNIALFGLDLREKGENGRSDTIMIVSIDKKHKKIKLSSIMRDTYVKVKGHGETKINHAYSFGGPELAIRTLNENFQMDIRDYVTIDIFSLEKLIDSLDGITIDVKKEEVAQININMQEVAQVSKSSFEAVRKPGSQLLNGRQAVGYARIRAVGNGDYERTDRQRRVMDEIFTKINDAGIAKYPQVVSQLLPYVETSMSKMDIITLGTSVLTSGTRKLDQMRFPLDGYAKGKTIGGVWYLAADMPATRDQLQKYIYEDIIPVSK